MKKLKRGRKLSRKRDQRRALLKSLTRELFLREKIKSTQAKAKELAVLAEKIITRAKIDNLSNRRMILRKFSKKTVQKIFKDIAPRYKDRKGGYVRVTKLGRRQSDGAKMAIIELIK